jgi:hypothetical protein
MPLKIKEKIAATAKKLVGSKKPKMISKLQKKATSKKN